MALEPTPPADEIEGERGVTPLTRKRAGLDFQKVIGVVGIMLLAGGMLWASFSKPAPKAVVAAPSPAGEQVGYEPAQAQAGPAVKLQSYQQQQATIAADEKAQAAAQTQTETLAQKLLDASYQAPLGAYKGAGGSTGSPTAAAPSPPPASPGGGVSGLAAKLVPTQEEAASAALLPDRDYLLTEGTHIPCVLQTALDSTQPGYTTCVIPDDILSDNGKVVLLDKGTKLVGEYSGDINQGQSRIFVLWTRAETPEGVIIALDSPATDALGRSGFDGHVDNHFWQRFGAAIMLSLIDDSTTAGGNYLAARAGTNYLQSTESTGTNTASTALQNSINIPPTLEKNQGEEVAVTLARDLDFSGVYALQPAQ